MPVELRFHALGIPAPKGSGRAILSKSTGRPMWKADNPRTKPWQAVVASEARIAAERAGGFYAIQGVPVSVEAEFIFPRPKSAPVKKRPFMTVKPDEDKLSRALKDALAGVVFHDDAQVVRCLTTKRYARDGEPAGAHVVITMGGLTMEGEPAWERR